MVQSTAIRRSPLLMDMRLLIVLAVMNMVHKHFVAVFAQTCTCVAVRGTVASGPHIRSMFKVTRVPGWFSGFLSCLRLGS